MHRYYRKRSPLAFVLFLCLAWAVAPVLDVAAQQKETSPSRSKMGDTPGPRIELDPMGWVKVGYDFNHDGIYDAFELISVYDLEKRKQQQRQAAKPLGERKNFFEQSSFLAEDDSEGKKQKAKKGRLKGTISQMAAVDIANSDSKHAIAKIKTDRGTMATVDLGPQKNLQQLDIGEDDRIKVLGVEGSIDDKAILMANSLQVNGLRVMIDRRETKPLKKFAATVLRTRTVTHKGHTNMLARVELEDGLKTIVNLGPAADLPKITEGDEIQLLARITEVRGKKALLADRVRFDGKTYPVDWQSLQKKKKGPSA